VTGSGAVVPLCVELDGALSPVYAFQESVISLLRHAPGWLLSPSTWRAQTNTVNRQRILAKASIDATIWPLNDELLAWLRAEKAAGRQLILLAEAPAAATTALATKLDLFDEVMVSDAHGSLSSENKADTLVERFGQGGFDYVGNGRTSARVWAAVRRGVV